MITDEEFKDALETHLGVKVVEVEGYYICPRNEGKVCVGPSEDNNDCYLCGRDMYGETPVDYTESPDKEQEAEKRE